MKSDLEKLRAIIEASKRLTSTLDLDELLNIILDVALAEIEAERGTVFLHDLERKEIFSRILRGDEIAEIRLPLGHGIAGNVAATGVPMIIPDAYADPRFNPDVDRQSGFKTRSILCLPLIKGEGEIIGVIELLNKREGVFSPADADYLSALAAHMVIAVENARAHLERLEQERTRRELELAAQIQQRLLPQEVPDFPGVSIAARATPCHCVAGDYYDFLKLPTGGFGLVIADVSGKGIPAALITSALHAYIHAGIRAYSGVAELAARLNRLLWESVLASSFVTMVLVEIDQSLRRLRYCNCGHNPPVLIQGGELHLLKASGTIAGMFQNAEFSEMEIELDGNEQLLLYTDGLTEAAGSDDEDAEEFGLDRLLELSRSGFDSPGSWLNSISEELVKFVAGGPLEDDLTVIAVSIDKSGG